LSVISPFVGGAFGAGLRPQYKLVLAVLGTLALASSASGDDAPADAMGFGYRPATIERPCARVRRRMERLNAITPTHSRQSQFEESPVTIPVGRRCSTSRQREVLHRLARLDVAYHQGDNARDLRCEPSICTRKRDGRAGWPETTRWSCGSLLFRSRPERGVSLHRKQAARMLPQAQRPWSWDRAKPERARWRTAANLWRWAWRRASGTHCRGRWPLARDDRETDTRRCRRCFDIGTGTYTIWRNRGRHARPASRK